MTGPFVLTGAPRNRSGSVDDLDYNSWRGSFGSTADTPADGNANGTKKGSIVGVFQSCVGEMSFGLFALRTSR
jgi:hypothetical protein